MTDDRGTRDGQQRPVPVVPLGRYTGLFRNVPLLLCCGDTAARAVITSVGSIMCVYRTGAADGMAAEAGRDFYTGTAGAGRSAQPSVQAVRPSVRPSVRLLSANHSWPPSTVRRIRIPPSVCRPPISRHAWAAAAEAAVTAAANRSSYLCSLRSNE